MILCCCQSWQAGLTLENKSLISIEATWLNKGWKQGKKAVYERHEVTDSYGTGTPNYLYLKSLALIIKYINGNLSKLSLVYSNSVLSCVVFLLPRVLKELKLHGTQKLINNRELCAFGISNI